MASPRYKSRSQLVTRRSCRERVFACPSDDLGATALDRPLLIFEALPWVAAPPSRPRSCPPARRGAGWLAAVFLGGCLAAGAASGAVLSLVL